jgi:hypothetical protein
VARDDLELAAAVGKSHDGPPPVGRVGLAPEQAGRLHAGQGPDERGDLDADAACEHADRLTVLVPELIEDVVLARMDAVRLEPPTEFRIDSLERLRKSAKQGGGEGLAGLRHKPKVPLAPAHPRTAATALARRSGGAPATALLLHRPQNSEGCSGGGVAISGSASSGSAVSVSASGLSAAGSRLSRVTRRPSRTRREIRSRSAFGA